MHQVLLFVTIVFFSFGNGGYLEDSRIVGGQIAPDKAFPYQVGLRRTLEGTFMCGGLIHSKRTVITAATCIGVRTVRDYTIRAGTNIFNGSGIILRPTRHLKHPQWDTLHKLNNIALVYVDADIEFTDAIQPIALEPREIGAEVPVVLSGWGRLSTEGILPRDLYYINLTTISNEDCQFNQSVESIRTIHESTLCTLTKPEEGACYGDQGSPLTYQGKLVGVVSWFEECGIGQPDMYSRISWYYVWIIQNTEY